MKTGATFSPCRRYRYTLTRHWGSGSRTVAFIGLNPSTADETVNDRTINRCIAFAQSWGFDTLQMLNLFAFRSTYPHVMRAQEDPIGPENDEAILSASRNCELIVAAWGVDGAHMRRADAVRQMLPNLHYLKLTKDGHPGHPLYLPGHLRPVLWDEEL